MLLKYSLVQFNGPAVESTNDGIRVAAEICGKNSFFLHFTSFENKNKNKNKLHDNLSTERIIQSDNLMRKLSSLYIGHEFI